MLVVRVELHSARTLQITEIARMHIANDGTGTDDVGHYSVATFHGRGKEDLDKHRKQRSGTITGWKRNNYHVWHLVVRALVAMNFKYVPSR